MDQRRGSYRLFIEHLAARAGTSVSGLARRAQLAPSTLNRFLNDESAKHTLSTTTIEKIGAAAGVGADEAHRLLAYAKQGGPMPGPDQAEDPPRTPMVKVVGMVGAGAEVHRFEGDYSDDRIDEADAPPGADEHTVAVIVVGSSMEPAFHDRDVIYYRNVRTEPDQLIGRECVIRLADGRTFVKILMRGNGPGFFTLFSYNAPLISDVVVEWALPVRWVKRE